MPSDDKRAAPRPASRCVLAAVLLAAGGAAFAEPKPSSAGLAVEPIDVYARVLTAFDRMDPAKVDFGRLTWRGGLVVRHDNYFEHEDALRAVGL